MYTGPHIVTDQLVLAMDAASARSYPGSGVYWYGLTENENQATLQNGPTFVDNNYISFDDDINRAFSGHINTISFAFNYKF